MWKKSILFVIKTLHTYSTLKHTHTHTSVSVVLQFHWGEHDQEKMSKKAWGGEGDNCQ